MPTQSLERCSIEGPPRWSLPISPEDRAFFERFGMPPGVEFQVGVDPESFTIYLFWDSSKARMGISSSTGYLESNPGFVERFSEQVFIGPKLRLDLPTIDELGIQHASIDAAPDNNVGIYVIESEIS